MANGTVIKQIHHANGPHWSAVLAIYRQAFPAWEREAEYKLARRLAMGNYQLFVGIGPHGAVFGFYFIEENVRARFSMLNYLAVTASQRGKGLGTLLCRHALDLFRAQAFLLWLLVEAENRQAIFYARLGLCKIHLDYRVPKYASAGEVAMHLMILPQRKLCATINTCTLRKILIEIFTAGYQLTKIDPRLLTQLGRLPDPVEIHPWPPQARINANL